MGIVLNRVVRGLPSSAPFIAPEQLERERGRPFKLRLGANESAFGCSPAAKSAARAALAYLPFYAEPRSDDLRQAIARRHRVDVHTLVVGSGIDDLLGLTARACLDPGDSVVASHGSYPTFHYFAGGAGAVVHTVPYRGFRNDLNALAEKAKAVSARLVYLANPDNPTGSWLSPEEIGGFASSLPGDCLLMLDEAYADFCAEEELIPIEETPVRCIRYRTFSKAHGLAGCRIGYLIADAALVEGFNKVRVQFGVNLVAQAAALASLGDDRFVSSVVREVEAGRREYDALGRELAIPTIASRTNFVAFDFGSTKAAEACMNALERLDIFVRKPKAPGLAGLVRVTVGSASERKGFAEAMRTIAARARGDSR